jgi:hypothetical protein
MARSRATLIPWPSLSVPEDKAGPVDPAHTARSPGPTRANQRPGWAGPTSPPCTESIEATGSSSFASTSPRTSGPRAYAGLPPAAAIRAVRVFNGQGERTNLSDAAFERTIPPSAPLPPPLSSTATRHTNASPPTTATTKITVSTPTAALSSKSHPPSPPEGRVSPPHRSPLPSPSAHSPPPRPEISPASQ